MGDACGCCACPHPGCHQRRSRRQASRSGQLRDADLPGQGGSLLPLSIGVTSAEAGGYGRSNCEQRIFEKDEDRACFESKDDVFLFERDQQDEQLLPAPSGDILLTTKLGRGRGEFSCDCQLRRKYDVICAENDGALIAGTDRRGRWISGEALTFVEQVKFVAKRVPVEVCR